MGMRAYIVPLAFIVARAGKRAAISAAWLFGSMAVLYCPISWTAFWLQDTFLGY